MAELIPEDNGFTASERDLKTMADRLRLTYCRDHLDDIINAATDGKLNPREVLTLVFGREIERREVNRARQAFMAAHFPFKRGLDDFDLNAQPCVDPALIRELALLDWVERGDNLLFLGPPGVGKTHLAIAFGGLAIRHGYSVLFKNAEALVKELLEARKEDKLERELTKLCKVKLLIIDEFGYLPFNVEGSHLLFKLITRRYERKSVVITSNRPLRDWGSILGDPTVSGAIMDRFLHHCRVLTMNGESYRMLEVKKQNLLGEVRET